MNSKDVPVNDYQALKQVLGRTEALLLDFDGPICSVFANFPATVVADHLREILTEGGNFDIPPDIRKTLDPFDIFKYAARLGTHEATYIEAALRAYEVEAIATAEPTSGAHELLTRCAELGKKVAIVSNNSAEAVESYLYMHRLFDYVAAVVGRTSSEPDLLKPHPSLVLAASTLTATALDRCTFVGDSESDVIAAKSAGVNAIGYANKPGKIETLAAHNPSVVITEMNFLVDTID